MESLFKCKSYEIDYAELSEKVTVFKKYLLLKSSFYEKVAAQKKVPVSKNYMIWMNNYLFWKKSSSETVAAIYLEEIADEKPRVWEYLFPRSS